MSGTLVALTTSVLGALWAIRQLRQTVQARRYEWVRLAVRGGEVTPRELIQVWEGSRDSWAYDLVRAVSATGGRRGQAVNAALLDAEGQWAAPSNWVGSCVRLAAYGGLLGLVVVWMQRGSWVTYADVFVVAGAGAWLSLVAGQMVGREEHEQRREIDEWVRQAVFSARQLDEGGRQTEFCGNKTEASVSVRGAL